MDDEEEPIMALIRRNFRRVTTTVIALGLTAGATFATAAPASAAEGDGDCGWGDVCLFWGGNQTGAMAAFYNDQPDYYQNSGKPYLFPNNGRGQGEKIDNNVASAYNHAVFSGVRIYYNSNYNAGTPNAASQYIAPGDRRDLVAGVRNDNASHRFS